MHLYLVADCKTDACEAIHILKYLGGKSAEGMEIRIPDPLWLRCRKCYLSHDYSLGDVRQVERAEAPSSDFRDMF
jgi:hypothetical protein